MRENISDALRKIKKFLGDDMHLFLAVDEAQVAIQDLKQSFAHRRPLLPELVRMWSDHTTDDQSFIFAGTDILKVLFNDVDGLQQLSLVLWNGQFRDPEDEGHYVSKFLPPALRNSASGRFLISRIWRWLRGRHRYTASFSYVLTNDGYETTSRRTQESTRWTLWSKCAQKRVNRQSHTKSHWFGAVNVIKFSGPSTARIQKLYSWTFCSGMGPPLHSAPSISIWSISTMPSVLTQSPSS
ncbi:hypothetical protein DFH07DRAFT_180452 [Mycena maculata]|uniref:Uncharacterized protein n=1 Tax=Mycena maculata TaxID=230809 RepID=A0AAD7HY26_9AGAR|nr:hypothetical protein DFH07DRAFT_180452 [Mycena maculata]